MASSYFENFPDLIYNGKRCKDITRRSIIRAGNTTSPFNFYPYELQHQLRSDHVAEYYYEDAELDWLILLSNDIVDPYYGWYNTNEQFRVGLIENFGSIETAQQKVLFYRNNWADDDVQLTVNQYDNIIVKSLRKYYEPVYGPGLSIIAYKRKENDIVQNTNKIIEYTISSNNAGVALEIGELVNIRATGTETNIGFAEVETANSSIFRIKNVRGSTTANSSITLDIIGRNTSANVSTNNSQILFENITDEEAVFYSPVYAYDHAEEQNESRKNLNLIGDGMQELYVNQFNRLMNRDIDDETGLAE